jgi:hypothetical protein
LEDVSLSFHESDVSGDGVFFGFGMDDRREYREGRMPG